MFRAPLRSGRFSGGAAGPGSTASATSPRRTWHRARRGAVASLLALAPAAPLAAAMATHGAPAGAATPQPRLAAFNLVWSHALPDNGNPIALSSPNLVDGGEVAVGDRAGNLWEFDVDNGSDPMGGLTPAVHVTGPIDSTPSLVPGQGVAVGIGNAGDPYVPASFAFMPDAAGNHVVQGWNRTVQNQPSDPKPYTAAPGGLAVGAAAGVGAFLVGGTLGQELYAMTPGGGVMGGFPFFQGDGDVSTAAVAPIYNWKPTSVGGVTAGADYIVDYGDSSAGIALGTTYTNGSIMRVLDTAGHQICRATTTQSGESSPAVGELAPNTQPLIVAGSTDYFQGAPDTNKLFAWNNSCNLVWSDTLNGVPMAGPALANTQGNGQLQVVEGTNVNDANSSGSVYDIAPSGQVLWSVPATGAVIGSVATLDPSNQGYQDVLVPTTHGVMVLDGRTGQDLANLEPNEAFQSTPLVTADSNGSIGVTLAGYDNANQGVIDHFEIAGSHGNALAHAAGTAGVLAQPGGWPMFHHDPQLTGNAGIAAPVVQVPCKRPAGTPQGYDLVASDGGLFNYGNLPFCGSLGAISLNRPVVGLADTADGGGYWMVAADGGMFAFGDATFYGSMGGKPLNAPIVAMAPTHDGRGYWLVASDGGIFSFGDARFHGSTGGMHLNRPIVGFAPTADGGGYWLVAADGGIFNFGDARFHGSTGAMHLNRPIVGMAADAATGGYWLVASDGGIFSFVAPFHGSTGSMHLNSPIVGMEATGGGSGYRFVGADGGIFSYLAPFFGSMGGKPLNSPIVAIAGY